MARARSITPDHQKRASARVGAQHIYEAARDVDEDGRARANRPPPCATWTDTRVFRGRAMTYLDTHVASVRAGRARARARVSVACATAQKTHMRHVRAHIGAHGHMAMESDGKK